MIALQMLGRTIFRVYEDIARITGCARDKVAKYKKTGGWEGTPLPSYLIALAHEFHRADEREEIPNTIGAHPNLLYPGRHDDVGGKV